LSFRHPPRSGRHSDSPAITCHPQRSIGFWFTRDELIADGAPEVAIDYLFANMALTLDDFKAQLKADRDAGQSAISGTPSRNTRSWPSTTARRGSAFNV
jgi:hypothetical protein